MRKAMALAVIFAVIPLLVGTGEVSAKQVEFNYQGRVKVNGTPFNGLGNFKFAIVDAPGSVSYWSNDGSSLSGSEPAAAVEIEVSDGVFNVIIGDDSITNMTELPPSIFNVKNKKLHLRTWFSDGTHGYEQLQPDKQITNALLMGLVAEEGTDIYVDPATGDDDYAGLNPDHPKMTIQSAWDALPNFLEQSATIHLADGVYRESVYMTGKTVVGDATITILGNVSNPTAVRITGADAGNETLPVRETGLRIDDQTDLLISGVLIDYYGLYGLLARVSTFTMTDCEFGYNAAGSDPGGALHAETCVVDLYRVNSTGDHTGFYALRGSQLTATDCTLIDNDHRGVTSAGTSNVHLLGCSVDGCLNTAIHASGESYLQGSWRDPTSVTNSSIALSAASGGTILAQLGTGYPHFIQSGNSTVIAESTGGNVW